tara:strand:- start:641 stop:892 length:252 start_codon:yes stop_codon:yes gene_type:complete
MSFAYKCSVGRGYFIAGVLLELIQFPEKTTQINQIETSAIQGLGYDGGPILLVIYLSSIFLIRKYPITRENHFLIRTQMDQRT